jgi:hypothetical protein
VDDGAHQSGAGETERIVGTASYFVDSRTGLADVAYDRTIDYARRHGLRGFTADVLMDNGGMMAVFRRSGLRMETHVDAGAFEVTMLLD